MSRILLILKGLGELFEGVKINKVEVGPQQAFVQDLHNDVYRNVQRGPQFDSK